MPTRREIRAKDKRLAEALGRRLAELRREVGFTQAQVARLMGRRGKGSGNLVSRLEKGGVERPTLALVADYLRAIRRSIRDVAGVIDEHTSKPWMPDERVEKAITKLKLPKEVEDRVVRYDVKTEMDRRYSRGRKTEVNETERVKRAQNLALALMQQEKLEAWMNEVLPEIEGYTRSKAVLKRHGRRVWGILKRTRPMTEEDRILPDKRRRRAGRCRTPGGPSRARRPG